MTARLPFACRPCDPQCVQKARLRASRCRHLSRLFVATGHTAAPVREHLSGGGAVGALRGGAFSSSRRGCQAFVSEPLPAWPQLSLIAVSRERAGPNDGVPASRAEHMARCSDQRGQGPRPGPAPRAPRGLLHPRAVVECCRRGREETEHESEGAIPRARPRMRAADQLSGCGSCSG